MRMRIAALLAALLALGAAPAGVQAGAPVRGAALGELRGLWVVRTGLVSPAEVDRVIELARAGGFNALFVQVRGRGDAFYASRLAPRSVLLERQPRTFDPLERLVSRAHAAGLQVHAWVNVLLVAGFSGPRPAGHPIDRHPEWVMVPRGVAAEGRPPADRKLLARVAASSADPDIEGYYLSPFVPGVQRHLEEVVAELAASYPVDGLHLDFIRYPGPEYDFSSAARAAYRAAGGSGDVVSGSARFGEAWAEVRREALTALVRRLSAAARRARPGLVVSMAAVPEPERAVGHKFQDWPRWAAEGLIDALCPMTYTADAAEFDRTLAAIREAAGGHVPIWAGIGAYRLPVEETIGRVHAARAAGMQGVVLFSHESLTPDDGRRLQAGAFPVAGGAPPAPGVAAGGRAPGR